MKTKKLIISAITFALWGCGIEQNGQQQARVEEKVLSEEDRWILKRFCDKMKQQASDAHQDVLSFIKHLPYYKELTKKQRRYISRLCKRNKEEVIDFIQKPLSQWPKLDPLPSQEEKDYYHITWNPKQTLKENQEMLVDMFLINCLDLSFKKTGEITNYCTGKTTSEQEFFFSSTGNIDPSYVESADTKGIVLVDKLKGKKLSFTTNAANCMGFSVFADNMAQYQEQFRNYVSEIVKNPAGCWLLRVILSKMVANLMPKIILIPANCQIEDQGPIAAITVFPLRDAVAKKNQNKIPVIMFNPDSLSIDIPVPVIRKKEEDMFELFDTTLPIDLILLHEIIHHIHTCLGEKLINVYDTIDKRTGDKFANAGIPPIGRKSYGNDEEYQTMYGLTSKGLSLLNESFYFASIRKCIRPAHSIFMGKVLFYTRMYDEELLNFYLSPDPTLKFPEFGKEDFRCSDITENTEDYS